MGGSTSLYNQAVHVTEEYLGPAGERFMRRQIGTHLGIEPEELRQNDLSNLIEWASLAFALLTNNRRDVETFTRDLRELTVDKSS
jgi:hypothetical protein